MDKFVPEYQDLVQLFLKPFTFSTTPNQLNQMTEAYVPYVSSIGTWPLNTVCIDAL